MTVIFKLGAGFKWLDVRQACMFSKHVWKRGYICDAAESREILRPRLHRAWSRVQIRLNSTSFVCKQGKSILNSTSKVEFEWRPVATLVKFKLDFKTRIRCVNALAIRTRLQFTFKFFTTNPEVNIRGQARAWSGRIHFLWSRLQCLRV